MSEYPIAAACEWIVIVQAILLFLLGLAGTIDQIMNWWRKNDAPTLRDEIKSLKAQLAECEEEIAAWETGTQEQLSAKRLSGK